MKILLGLAVFSMGFVLTCSPPQTAEERCSRWDAEWGVKQYYKKHAIDPESVQFRNWRVARVEGEGCSFYVQFEVNAKNTFGGYTGWKSNDLTVRYEGNDVYVY